MLNVRTSVVAVSAAVAAASWLSSGQVRAADSAAAAPAKPALPAISDLLDASGISATGFVSGTFNYQGFSQSGGTAPADYNTFTFQQASFTVAKQPASGWGAFVNVLAGQNMYQPNYAPFTFGPPSSGASAVTSTQVQLAQGYVQYAGGPVTIIGGKFATLAGAEVYGSAGNTNVSRSILYAYEPVTHTGARLTWAANGQVSFIVGVNNGWIYSDETSSGPDKTIELGMALTPSKAFSWSVQGYTGRDVNKFGLQTTQSLVDTVVTWNATSALTLIGSLDWAQVDKPYGPGSNSASWWGVAGYINYAFNDMWRVSLRGEYYDDTDGYLTLYSGDAAAFFPGGYLRKGGGSPVGEKLGEGTVTFGFDPTKNVEVRFEGRYDSYDGNTAVGTNPLKVGQGWIEMLWKF